MAEHDHSAIKEHMTIIGADGVHVGTVDHLMHRDILCGQRQRRPRRDARHLGQIRCRHGDRHITGGLPHAGDKGPHQCLVGSQAAIHLPVSSDEFLFHDDHVKTILPVCWLDSISAWACAASAAAKVR